MVSQPGHSLQWTPKIVLAHENISADKLEQLPKITGSVYITYQASGELEESHAEKPEIYPEGQDRRSQDIAAFSPGLTREQESSHKGSAAGHQPGNAAWRFLTRLLVLVRPPHPLPTRQGMPLRIMQKHRINVQGRAASE